MLYFDVKRIAKIDYVDVEYDGIEKVMAEIECMNGSIVHFSLDDDLIELAEWMPHTAKFYEYLKSEYLSGGYPDVEEIQIDFSW